MADYVKITDYAAKDNLLTGDPAKLVKGTEIGADFDAVATAVATKHDSSDIGVTVQAYSANLDEYAAVNPTAAGLALLDDATASDQLTTLGVSAFAKTILDDADEATFKATVNLEIGTDIQAYNTTLAGIAAGTTSLGGFRNKIINGCGWIDQRNNNTSVTINSTTNTFGPDRWAGAGAATDGVFVLVGTKATYDTSGKGFPSSIICQTTTADASIGVAQAYILRYAVEGQDVAAWRIGSAQAATVTLSFKAYSTLTGTHCVALWNNASNRSYVATYTINQASTWEAKSITIALDQTGTWATDTNAGIKLFWNLGSGSNYTAAAANTWYGANYLNVAGCQNVIGTLNAVLAITDVQLETGSVATPFETRSIEQELALCQRYYYRVSGALNAYLSESAFALSSTVAVSAHKFPVVMRTAPSALEQNGTAAHYTLARCGAAGTTACSSVPAFNTATTHSATVTNTVASGLSSSGAGGLYASDASAYLGWSAEL